jgi:heat shock protein HtpX
VAAATAQALQEDVYMTNDTNAFVAHRGGMMGIGSRRVMALGLPLLQVLTVSELSAVLAHEFGHYHAGDVALAPWIHKTGLAITRTVVRLRKNVLRNVFVAYGRLFLRITRAVARRQEFIADEVAASAAGPTAIISSLRKMIAASVAYRSYWHSDVSFVMAAGYRPPLIDGFAEYMRSAAITSALASVVATSESSSRSNPYDTHPSLKERVEALSALPQRASTDSRPAVALVRSLPEWERRVLSTISLDIADCRLVEWSRVGELVCPRIWGARLRACGKALPACSIGTIHITTESLIEFGRATIPRGGSRVTTCASSAGGSF